MLNASQALLHPRPATLSALAAIIPWGEAKVTTYVLNQQDNRLARAGYLQAQKRAGRPESDIIQLAPALETPHGHPAIWQKLLAHYLQEAAQLQIERIFADVPDQPLPVTTFAQAGFKVYARQTIWRLTHDGSAQMPSTRGQIRLQTPQDQWALTRLYGRVTPPGVQQAHGVATDGSDTPPIFMCGHDSSCYSFVLDAQEEVTGCIQIRFGRRGVWLNLWIDMLDPDAEPMQALLIHALNVVRERSTRTPVYIGVSDYHGGLSAQLDAFGFAPFTDRARMVKPVRQWVRDPALAFVPAMERVGEAIPTQFVIPEEQRISTFNGHHSTTNL